MSNLIIKATRALTGRKLFVGARAGKAVAPHIAREVSLAGQTVWMEDGIAGRVKSQENGMCVVQVAVPTSKGLLALSDTFVSVKLSTLTPETLVVAEGKVKEWDLTQEFEAKMTEVKNGDSVIDYKDVFVEGLASTFAKTTAADRDGDYVLDNAFDDTLMEFRKNPVMLIDHRNSVENIAGSFDRIGAGDKGLMVRGRITNATDERSKRIRFLIVEKHLKAFSMGGMFFYGPDGRAIQKVDLFEVSLVAVPANQDALFSVRAPTIDEAKKAYKKHKAAGIGFAHN